jgi:hypothetical protein
MKDSYESAALLINIKFAEATADELDALTRSLGQELDTLGISEPIPIESPAAPAGSKGDPVTLGALAIAVLPVALPKIFDFLRSWVEREPKQRAIRVSLTSGKRQVSIELPVDGDSRSQVGELLKEAKTAISR